WAAYCVACPRLRGQVYYCWLSTTNRITGKLRVTCNSLGTPVGSSAKYRPIQEGDHMRKQLSPPNTVSTAKCPLNEDEQVNMDLRWLHVVDLHKFAVKQIEGLHRNDAWDIYFNALEWWRETYMDEPVGIGISREF